MKQKQIFTPVEYQKQAQKHTISPQKLIVISKEINTKKTEKVVKQKPTSTKGEVVQKQATAIGKKIKSFISVVGPPQFGDNGKKKTPSKRGKGRFGP